jgi:hypothetical protein
VTEAGIAAIAQKSANAFSARVCAGTAGVIVVDDKLVGLLSADGTRPFLHFQEIAILFPGETVTSNGHAPLTGATDPVSGVPVLRKRVVFQVSPTGPASILPIQNSW